MEYQTAVIADSRKINCKGQQKRELDCTELGSLKIISFVVTGCLVDYLPQYYHIFLRDFNFANLEYRYFAGLLNVSRITEKNV